MAVPRKRLLDAARVDAVEIYLDPTGDDSATGTSSDPIKTLWEASKRVPPFGQKTKIFLAAGDFPLPELEDYVIELFPVEFCLFNSLGTLSFYGTKEVITTFDVQSYGANVITAQGTPGWTPGAFVGYRIDREDWWPYRFVITANTADTITVAALFDDLPNGWHDTPVFGETITISKNASRILSAPTNPSSWSNGLFTRGAVNFHDIDFESTAATNMVMMPTARMGDGSWVRDCGFKKWQIHVVGEGYVVFDVCSLDASYLRASFGGEVYVQDIYSPDQGSIAAYEQGYLKTYGGCFLDNCNEFVSARPYGAVRDAFVRIWADNCINQYAGCWEFAQYKQGRTIAGYSGHNTFGQSLFTFGFGGPSVFVLDDLANMGVSGSSDFKFWNLPGYPTLSRADLIAGNPISSYPADYIASQSPNFYSDNRGIIIRNEP